MSSTTIVAAASPGTSAVSWPAIIGGAVAAASISIVLLLVGAGLGLASVSPWPGMGSSATTFTIVGAIWLIIVQWLSAAVGGYITGRLRTPWVGHHTHEVFFRDTANGFLMWALATLLGAMIVTSALGSLAGGVGRAATSVAASTAQGAAQGAASNPSTPSAVSGWMDYGVDRLFRTASPSAQPGAGAAEARTEATRILANSLRTGEMPPADRTYLAQLVAARTGISQADAEKRVDEMVNDAKATADKARAAADTARKAASATSLFAALSMVIGAFIAAAAAAYGGAGRDDATA
jgi:hypothetical protein